MGNDQQEYYLTQSSYEEFQRQDVFPTLEDFVEAMPVATRSIHLVPAESVDISGMDKDSLIVVVASDAGYFGQLSQIHVNPTREDPSTNDESMYKVDDANDLLKEQTTPDSIKNDSHPSLNSPQKDDTETWQKHTHPGDSDEYDRSHPNPHTKKSYSVLIPWEVLTANKTARHHKQRVALTWGEITSGLSSEIEKSATSCKVSLKKADPANNRWTFVVSSESGKHYVVHLKALPRKNATVLGKVDLKIGCSCDFWKWQGPDHWASRDGYLDRKPRSNGAAPTVRDPQGKNRVCKHVYAASKFFLKYRMPPPTRAAVTSEEAAELADVQKTASTTLLAKTSLKIRRMSGNLP